MYGKVFASMFTGSMVGTGAINFAVMSYVIANMRPDRTAGAQVELNPRLLAMILGEPEGIVAAAIAFLCEPDQNSRTEGEDGRRLVRLGQFDYRVVNGAKYRAIRDEETRREQNRLAKQRERAGKPKSAKSKGRGVALERERRFVRADANGETETADRIASEGLPAGPPAAPAPPA